MKIIATQLDLARQKENLQFIKSFYDFAKRNGYNTMLLMLEATTVRTEKTSFFKESESYSMVEMKEIVAYGDKIGINTIPMFQNVGHLERLFEYPQFAHFSEYEDDAKDGRGFHGGRGCTACISNPEFYEFIDEYILEVITCFTSDLIAILMDEVFEFAVCPRCKERLANGETREDMYHKHIMHSYDLLKSVNKRLMMCEDFFEYMDIAERLPRDIVLCVWDYMHIGDEVGGHWTNRKKRDLFRYYEELGFEYMYTVYANRASSVYNLETFDRYADRYHPLGACMANFCRADTFYQGSYPYIAYAGRKWSGIATKEDRADIYAEYLGSKECAELVLSMSVPNTYSQYNDVAMVCENDYFAKVMYADQLEYALKQLKGYLAETQTEEQREILFDIYGNMKEAALFFRLQRLGVDIFNNYESKKHPAEFFLNQLDDLRSEYDELEEEAIRMWKKYRQGIVSNNGALDKRFRNRRAMIDKVKADVIKNTDASVLYADLMLHDGFCTVKMDVKVKYYGEEEKRLYVGGAKSSLVIFEVGGCYTVRFAMENKPIEYVSFSVLGEGALYPLHFRYTRDGKKFVASEIEKICGNVQNEQLILMDDTQFATLGYNDGKEHFEDISLGKKPSEIHIKFRPLI